MYVHLFQQQTWIPILQRGIRLSLLSLLWQCWTYNTTRFNNL